MEEGAIAGSETIGTRFKGQRRNISIVRE